ncbi:MAG: PTS sugar transporter subunit IIC [Erysipelotrichaceae bacterium]|nr:PTS sugar transporter subunit IIC [Erysipelotrichaceae bacterium]
MIFDALLATFVYWLVYQTCYLFRMQYNVEPIVLAPAIGLALGDLQTGLIVGAALEAIFLGTMVVGGQRPSNPAIAAVVCTFLAIKTNLGIEAAVAIAYPVSVLGNNMGQYVRVFTFAVLPWMHDIVLKHDDIKKYRLVSYIFMFFVSFSAQYVAAFIFMALGEAAVTTISSNIPAWLINGFGASGRALAAMGMAITLNMLWDKEILGFYFIGFILFKALGLSLIQIAVLSVGVAMVYLFIDIKLNEAKKAAVVVAAPAQEGDDFDL